MAIPLDTNWSNNEPIRGGALRARTRLVARPPDPSEKAREATGDGHITGKQRSNPLVPDGHAVHAAGWRPGTALQELNSICGPQ